MVLQKAKNALGGYFVVLRRKQERRRWVGVSQPMRGWSAARHYFSTVLGRGRNRRLPKLTHGRRSRGQRLFRLHLCICMHRTSFVHDPSVGFCYSTLPRHRTQDVCERDSSIGPFRCAGWLYHIEPLSASIPLERPKVYLSRRIPYEQPPACSGSSSSASPDCASRSCGGTSKPVTVWALRKAVSGGLCTVLLFPTARSMILECRPSGLAAGVPCAGSRTCHSWTCSRALDHLEAVLLWL